MDAVHVRLLQADDITPVVEAFAVAGLNKPLSLYERYFAEQTRGERDVLLAFRETSSVVQ
jgi:hypothetical protein